MTDDLVKFLRERLDEEAARAKLAFSGQMDPESGWGAYRPEWQQHTTITPHVGIIHEAVQADHVVRWNPARILAEVDAKRCMLKLHERLPDGAFCVTCDAPSGVPGEPHGCPTLRLLALPYADHSDYREDWRP